MSGSVYEYLSILRVNEETAAAKKQQTSIDYLQTLDTVRTTIAERHATELAAVLDDPDAAHTLKTLIYQYTAEVLAGQDYDREAMTEKIYQDMAGLGLLTRYLYDPMVEEVNINAYNFLEIVYPDRTEYLYDEDAFASPEAALDIVKRMIRMGGKLLDAQTPRVDSDIGSGTRITALIPPLVSAADGVVASIRKQSRSSMTREQLIRYGGASPDMLDFLVLCLCYNVSLGVAGGTGSGKTTLSAFLINEYILSNDDSNSRVVVIEDSRELNLIQYDVDNDRPARVVYMQTKPAPNPVTMFDLIVSSLRFDPTLIVPAEVRDGAAYEAADAGTTGHTILTSFHADGAKDGYDRLVSLCRKANANLSNEQLLDMCIKAWPVIVFQKQLKDNSRKMMEVFEATGQRYGHVVGNSLFRFVVEQTERDGHGNITRVSGRHERCGCISPRLYQRLWDNGAPQEMLQRLFPEGHGEEAAP